MAKTAITTSLTATRKTMSLIIATLAVITVAQLQVNGELISLSPNQEKITQIDISSAIESKNGFAVNIEITDLEEGCISYESISDISIDELTGEFYAYVLVGEIIVNQRVDTVNTGSNNWTLPICLKTLDPPAGNVSFVNVNTTSKINCDKNVRLSIVPNDCDATTLNLASVTDSGSSTAIVLISVIFILILIALIVYVLYSKPPVLVNFWRERVNWWNNHDSTPGTDDKSSEVPNAIEDPNANLPCEKENCDPHTETSDLLSSRNNPEKHQPSPVPCSSNQQTNLQTSNSSNLDPNLQSTEQTPLDVGQIPANSSQSYFSVSYWWPDKTPDISSTTQELSMQGLDSDDEDMPMMPRHQKCEDIKIKNPETEIVDEHIKDEHISKNEKKTREGKIKNKGKGRESDDVRKQMHDKRDQNRAHQKDKIISKKRNIDPNDMV